MAYYDLGNLVPLTFEIRDTEGNLANAGAVTITINVPDGSVVTVTPSNPSTGRYQYDYLPSLPGEYTGSCVATGANSSAEPFAFYVGEAPAAAEPSPLVSLPVLASLLQLREWITEAQADDSKAIAALVSASTLVRSYTERPTGWVGEQVPDPVVEATINVARRRALTPDDGTTDQTAGPFSVKRDTGLWLSATDRLLLDHYRHSAGVTSMGTRGMFGDAEDLVTAPGDLPGSDPIPWE